MQQVMARSGPVSQLSYGGSFCRRNLLLFRRSMRAMLALPFAVSLIYGQKATPMQQLTFQPYHASGMYDVGDTVGWIVSPGPTAPTYAYKWTVRRNNADVLKEGKLDLSAGKDKIEIVGDQP